MNVVQWTAVIAFLAGAACGTFMLVNKIEDTSVARRALEWGFILVASQVIAMLTAYALGVRV